MRCENRNCADPDSHQLTVAPLLGPDGKLNTILCLPCAVEHGVWCQKHNTPHVGVNYTNWHFCGHCLREGMAEVADVDFLRELQSSLPDDDYQIALNMCLDGHEAHALSPDPSHWLYWSFVVATLQSGEATRERIMDLLHTVQQTHDLTLILPRWVIELYK